MAERRMFAKHIIDSDTFLDMPATAQLLYFQLGMRADDDGFINNPKRIMRDVRCSEDDLKMLIAKQYIIPFESGIIVIRHWRIHNYIRSDRYKPSECEEKYLVNIGKNKIYEMSDNGGIPSGIPDGNRMAYQMETQVSIGKVSVGKDRVGKVSVVTPSMGNLSTGYRGESQTDGLTDSVMNPIMDFFQANLEILTPFKLQMLQEYVKDYGLEWVQHAMEKVAALSADKRNIKYLGGVLSGWTKDNVPKPWESRNNHNNGGRPSAKKMADDAIALLEGGIFGDFGGAEDSGAASNSFSSGVSAQ